MRCLRQCHAVSKALEEKGYVRRFVDQKDRRNTLVEITKSGQEVLDESNEITNEFIRRVFEKTDKEEMARLVSYIHQQYDLAKEELEKIRQSQKKAADKHTGANHSANVRFTDS